MSRDGDKFGEPVAGIRGIFGAHTSYTDGRARVAHYVKGTKAAGFSVFVFTDPLETLTAETLGKLKADCAAASDDSFYACPGIEFTDDIGAAGCFGVRRSSSRTPPPRPANGRTPNGTEQA